MSDYPILLQLQGRLCVVIGGGPVAIRKARGLRKAGARVRLIASELAVSGGELTDVEVVIRPYSAGDLQGAFVAFAATDDRLVNAAVVREARQRGVLVGVADAPEEGDFTLPALLRRGNLTVSVATAGGSPALAALLRDRLADQLGPEWATVLEIAAALRQKRLTLQGKTEYNQAILRRLLEGGLPDLIADGDASAVDRLLQTLFGEGCTLAQLGIRLAKGMT
ncbi:MAG TPA: bifunctional precorrin-2 dehydrogenase/sirohydrochlorin ferrochelatase [Desulfuromonadales bacterium]|nr:bifunctional precorrin-2 dehydrogenase/sirohydrochlorin ferrochelatase [Desulfuromonadales bacterium]